MKSTVLLAILALSFSAPVLSDQGNSRSAPDYNKIAAELQLDEASKEKLIGIIESHRLQRQELRGKRKKMGNLREQHREELLTVLDYEQLYKFEKYMHQQRGRGHHKGHKKPEKI